LANLIPSCYQQHAWSLHGYTPHKCC
jgi:hypothetical protein